MKRIALSLITIVATVALTAGVTLAVWSDTAEVKGNTLSTANVELKTTLHGVIGETKPFTLVNFVPGQRSEEEGIGLINTGSVAVKVSMYVEYPDHQADVCKEINLVDVKRFGYPLGYGESAPLFSSGSLEELRGVEKATLVIAELPVGEEIRVYQTAELDVGAPNNVQNKTCRWTEVFIGETLY